MNLLLVDDSDADRLLMEHALTRSNMVSKTTHASSVEEAEQNLARESFDTILLSDQVTGWEALDLLQHIRHHNQSPHVAIVVVSDTACKDHSLNCIRNGAHDVILKSDISEARLIHAVNLASARSELELKLRQSYDRAKILAEHDALTGLPNRHVFIKDLRQSVEHAQQDKTSVALVLLNLDRFKFVNDTYGHHIGDEVLQRYCRRMKKLLGKNEKLYRMGGDEFAVLIGGLHYAHIGGLHERVLRELETPFSVDGVHIRLTLSCGVAFTPQNCRTAEHLMRCADIAMYKAKSLRARGMGQNHLCFVDEDAQAQFHRRFRIEHELESAIKNNEFVLHYQPVVCATDHSLLSCEALLRWQHPEKGLVYPDYFIDIAEETGQVVEMGRCIIEKACQQMAQWQRTNPLDVVMALNISPKQLYDKHLVDFFDRKLKEYGLTPQQFEIEITETALLKHTHVLLNNLEQFVQRGFGLALDDFGTGFSSIQHLQSFPISTVKIDRSLMPVEHGPSRTMSLLKGLVSMVNSMELSIVAEGIEDMRNASLCRELGVQRLQGYHFSKPVTAEEFECRFLFPDLMQKLAV